MMGRANPPQAKLFYTDSDLEARVRADHRLRAIAATIDFDFVCSEVADRYGENGNVSVAPPVVLKLMLLFVLYSVCSERELDPARAVGPAGSLGLDLDSVVPSRTSVSLVLVSTVSSSSVCYLILPAHRDLIALSNCSATR